MNLFDLTGKVAVVTGGARGIGQMIAQGLVDAGARVYVVSRKAADGGDVIAITADLSREEECVRVAAELGEREPDGVHILVNNAGAAWGAPLEEFPEAGWDKVLALNLKSPFFLTRSFLPLLEAAATAEDPSRVINVGSIDGMRVPEFDNFSYTASKAAVHQLTRVLAKKLGPRHITVNAIAPGPFPTKMMAALLEEAGDEMAASSPLGRIGRAEDMAGAAVYLSSRAGSWVTGTILPVDGGIWTTL